MKIYSNGEMLQVPPRGPAGPDGNPIGTIISYMGTDAPKDYLICDGSVYNISSYPDLSNFFESQFGAANYFGGDGTATFAVPDMRNLFLRGYHGEAEEQLSGDIGVKQKPSRIPRIWGSSTALGVYMKQGEEYFGIRDYDSEIGDSTGYTRYSTSFYSEAGQTSYFTTRPVNMAVLYCIKAVESTQEAPENEIAENIYSAEEARIGTWTDGKPLYRKVLSFSYTASDSTRTLSPAISGITVVMIEAWITYKGSQTIEQMGMIDSKNVSHRIYYNPSAGIQIASNQSDWNGSKITVILQYTKTTD